MSMFGRGIRARRAANEAHILRHFKGADQFFQSIAHPFVFDFARDAAMGVIRQQAPNSALRWRYWKSACAPLVPIGSLTTWTRTGWSIFSNWEISLAFGVDSILLDVVIEIEIHIEHLFEFFRIFQDVADVDEAIFSFIDIDEGRLDVMQDIGDSSAVDISGDLPRFFSIERSDRGAAHVLNRRSGFLWIRY